LPSHYTATQRVALVGIRNSVDHLIPVPRLRNDC
jgi:hypothetical protein